jgi:zinc transporter ZupT
VLGIWISGLLGSTIVGSMMGTLFFNGFVDPSLLGGLAGFLLFVCFRLWMGEARAQNDLSARLSDDSARFSDD